MKFKRVILPILLIVSFIAKAQKSPDKEQKIEEILQQLTLQEKVDMCHAQSQFSVAGVERLGIPETWMSDGPHGVRAEIVWDNWAYAGWTNDSITAFPALTCLAASFSPELAAEYGFAIGEEARYREKDVLLGPGVNIYRTPMNGRNFEYMGEDPFLASTMVVPYIKGVQKNGVAACVKHFALNNQEEWRGHINVNVSERALREIYLPAFKAAVQEAGVWSLMGAYNQYLGQHCCHNEVLLNKILKEEWGFDGVVISDWSGTHNTIESAYYGLDMEMGTSTNGLTESNKFSFNDYYLAKPFLKMLKSGEIDVSVVDEKVRRNLRLILRTSMNPKRPLGSVNTAEHQAVARNIATNGMVLLKNESFFPIDPNTKLTIAVIGENATRAMTRGGGSSELKPQYEISPLVGIQQTFKNANILHSMGYASGAPSYGKVNPAKFDADSLITAAIEIAAKADLVLFVGGLNKNHHQDCEGGDRLSFDLPFGQPELIQKIAEVNPNLAMIMVSGNAVSMPWLNNVKALMQTWYLGSEAGYAIADVISGKVNPSGKLPFSFPVRLVDNAAHYFGEISYPGDSINQHYLEDILVGYRWHDTKKIKPLFAFGYGLSYTDFNILNVSIPKNVYAETDKITVTCQVKNVGKVAGAEVVQVYIGKPNSKVDRAKKELKGFKKVNVLAKGTQTIEIEIDAKSLAFYNETRADWEVEKGTYEVYIGNSSDHVAKKLKFKIE